MHFRFILRVLRPASHLTLSLVLCSPSAQARAQDYPREALVQAYTQDVYASLMVGYCRSQRAPSAGRTQAAYQAWRARFRLRSLPTKLGLTAEQRATVAREARRSFMEELREEGTDPGEICAELAAEFNDWDPYEPDEVDGMAKYEDPFESIEQDRAEQMDVSPEPAGRPGEEPSRSPARTGAPAGANASSKGGESKSCSCPSVACTVLATGVDGLPYNLGSQILSCTVSCTLPKVPSCTCGVCPYGQSYCGCQ